MELSGEEELRIAVSTELTLAGGGGGGLCCWEDVDGPRLAGEPSDMVGKVDGGNIIVLLCCFWWVWLQWNYIAVFETACNDQSSILWGIIDEKVKTVLARTRTIIAVALLSFSHQPLFPVHSYNRRERPHHIISFHHKRRPMRTHQYFNTCTRKIRTRAQVLWATATWQMTSQLYLPQD